MGKEITVRESDVVKAADQDMDAFVKVFVDAIRQVAWPLTAETMALLNTSQLTLIAYDILRDEVMDGGFVQLIHNGYGPFFFLNPFAKMMKMWGLQDLGKLMFSAQKLYKKYHTEIEKDCSDEEFMALFERYPAFDDLDDEFVENEEVWTESIARYVDEHIDEFAKVEK
mgnify:CR=1 FL=1